MTTNNTNESLSPTPISNLTGKITPHSLKLIRQKLQAAVSDIDLDGMVITVGNASYSDHAATIKLEVLTKTSTGETLSKERIALNELSNLLGFNFGDQFVHDGDTYKITGYNPRARKYSVIGLNLKTRKEFAFLVKDVKENLIIKQDNQ